MSNLTTTAPPSTLSPTREITTLLDSFVSGIVEEGGVTMLTRMPTNPEREALNNRRVELVKLLRPISDAFAERERAASAVAIMLDGYSLHAALKGDPELTTASIIKHLMPLPLFAIQAVCKKIHDGRVEECLRFPPTIPQLYNLIEAEQSRMRYEGQQIVKVLNTRKLWKPKISEARRKEVGIELQNLAVHLRTQLRDRDKIDGAVAERIRTDAEDRRTQSILAEYKSLGIDPVYSELGPIAPATLRLMGRLPRPQPMQHPEDEQ